MALKLPTPRTLGDAIDSHDNGFNLVRLVCALLVVAFHAFLLNPVHPRADPLSVLLAPLTDLGSLAVGVFFMVSGLFVTHSWMRDPHLGRFALRRAARIVPGLFVCLLLSTVIAVCAFSTQGWAGLLDWAPWRYVFSSATLHWLRYIIPPDELRIDGVLGGTGLNGPLWTLYWEGRMYVMVALIGLSAFLPLRTWVRAAAIFLLLATNLFPTVLVGYIWETRMWSLFLCGMLLQTLAPQVRVGLPQAACALALAALNWTRSVATTASGLTWFGIALVLGALALWAGSSGGARARHVQRHDYSFGIYIYHWPILLMLGAAFPRLDAAPILAAALALTVPVAMLSWHLVEGPAMRAARRWMARPAPAPVPVVERERDAA